MEIKLKIGQWIVENRFLPLQKAKEITGALIKIIDIKGNTVYCTDYRGQIYSFSLYTLEANIICGNDSLVKPIEAVLYL